MVTIKPVRYCEAARFIKQHHKLRSSPPGHLFSIGAYRGDDLVAVVMMTRPNSSQFDNGLTIQGARLAKRINKKNLDSYLFSRVVKICRILGYNKIITYTAIDERGTVERATGFQFDKKVYSHGTKHKFIKKRWVKFLD